MKRFMTVGAVFAAFALLLATGEEIVRADVAKGIEFFDKEQYDEAEKEFAAAVKADKKNAKAFYYLGRIELERVGC